MCSFRGEWLWEKLFFSRLWLSVLFSLHIMYFQHIYSSRKLGFNITTLGTFILMSSPVLCHWSFHPVRPFPTCSKWHYLSKTIIAWNNMHKFELEGIVTFHFQSLGKATTKSVPLDPATLRSFPAASSGGSEICLECRVNSRQEAIKVSFIHSHYCFYVFAIMFIDMFERSTSCSSVQLPVKMGHLSRNKPHRF